MPIQRVPSGLLDPGGIGSASFAFFNALLEGVRATATLFESKMLNLGLSTMQSSSRREDIEMAMEEELMEIMPRLEKRTHYLAMLANISTLLGLLGTIQGLIQAFNSVAAVDPSLKAEILSSSISVAMNTTAFGLCSAIPLIVIFSILQAKTTEIVDSLEMATVKFVNLIHKKKQQA